ncbi:hypothetical protein PFISCL1PPCAC_3273, partial [Pristionchus fissidentatus]
RGGNTSNALAPLLLLAMFGAVLAVLFASSEAWQDRPSGIQCARNDLHEPILVVVSMDGFASRYLDLGVTPNIEAMGRNGARAEHIYPTYPSRTFVNHYTMATGLWADSHGIVDNYILDCSISDEVESVARSKKQGLFRGEPIWSAYKRQRGGTTACLNWLGCNVNITGSLPDYAPPYNSKATIEQGIDQVLSWLEMPAGGRPHLILAYLSEPDHTGHFRKSEDEIPSILRRNDAVVDRLMSGIQRLGLIDCVNVLLVSDHGMTEITNRVYWDEHIPLDGLIPAYGIVGRIHRNSTTRSDDSVTGPFQCSRGDKYRVYDRSTLPVKYHYSATPRVGDYIFESQPGTTFYATKKDDWMMTGDHGYDPVHPTMRTIFFARGPSIRPGVVLPPFQTVEYFNIFGDLLGMRPEYIGNNGTLGIVDEMYARPPPRVTTALPIPSCSATRRIRPCSNECNREELDEISRRTAACDQSNTLSSIAHLSFIPISYCSLRLCDTEILTGPATIVSELLTPEKLAPSNAKCSFEFEDRSCSTWPSPNNQSIALMNLLMTTSDALSSISRARVPLLKGFVQNFMKPLDDMLTRFVHKYRRVAVITGTISDANFDGRMDNANLRNPLPSHIFRIIFTCPEWRSDGLGCSTPSETRPLTFILPHIEKDINCLSSTDYLFAHTARVRDVEELTGLRFFADPNVVPHHVSLKIRTHTPQKLWDF